MKRDLYQRIWSDVDGDDRSDTSHPGTQFVVLRSNKRNIARPHLSATRRICERAYFRITTVTLRRFRRYVSYCNLDLSIFTIRCSTIYRGTATMLRTYVGSCFETHLYDFYNNYNYIMQLPYLLGHLSAFSLRRLEPWAPNFQTSSRMD